MSQEEFIKNHKARVEDFIRKRILNFGVTLLLILQKSTKSLQIRLNELLMLEKIPQGVTASAYSQARHKLKHTALIELNEYVIKEYYSDDDFKTWQGYRCIGVDASKLVLPLTDEIASEFGDVIIKNGYGTKTYCGSLWECYYDVLNHIVIKTNLNPGRKAEREAALELSIEDGKKDLLIFDRGYASYEFLVKLKELKKDYVIRCPNNVFKGADELFAWGKTGSQIKEISAPKSQGKAVREQRLPATLRIRFVSVMLSTGELEVLVTSLLDASISGKAFKELYHLRWGIEGFFDLVKNRLVLENFTGKSVESVHQDFWSSIFISNLETILTEETDIELSEQSSRNRYEQKVNKAITFNAIKNMVFEILYEKTDLDEIMKKLTLLFKATPTLVRPGRSLPRKRSCRRSEHFLRRIKKQVF